MPAGSVHHLCTSFSSVAVQVGTVVTVEHSPVYTLGRREKEDTAVADYLKKVGAAVIKVWP